ncbi:MAG: Ig-like domain-containing protein [Candidatus Buchananbacteria bacterium]|nr:Ig-like domain-containing protein [Candidatus Buchananbacteria bacterium]
MKEKNTRSILTKTKVKISSATAFIVIILVASAFSSLMYLAAFSLPSSSLNQALTVRKQSSNQAESEVLSMALAKGNADLLNANIDYQRAQSTKSESLNKVLSQALLRKSQLLKAAQTDPDTALSFIIPAELKKKLPVDVQSLIESPIAISGQLDVIQLDDFQKNKSEVKYFLKDKISGKRFELHVPKKQAERLSSADSASLDGYVLGPEELLVENIASSAVTTNAITAIERKALFILVNFQDKNTSMTADKIDTAVYGSTNSVDGLYREMSFGQLGFKRDTDGNGSVDVVGPFKIAASSTDSCAYNTWGDQAINLAVASGVNTGLYQHLVFILPGNSCGWGGIANVGCATTCKAWIASASAGIIGHELGHNLGMRHAGTDTNNDGVVDKEYGDSSDLMGNGSVGLRQYNGAHKNQMTWFNLFPGKVQTITASGTFRLSPTEQDPGVAIYPQVIKIAIPGTSEYYYLSYRTAVGYDSLLTTKAPSNLTGVNIHRYTGGSVVTRYIKTLSNGTSFDDPAMPLQITQTATSTDPINPYVEFTANMAQVACIKANPTVTLSPTSATIETNKTQSFNLTVKNNDSNTCPPVDYTVTPLLPSGFTQIGAFDFSFMVPGSSVTKAFTVTASNEAGTYTITEQVVDNSSSVYFGSASAQINLIAPDATGPAITISDPADGSNIPTKGTLTVSASATDSSGVASMIIKLDEKILKTCITASCSDKVAVSQISSGSHAITVTATDSSASNNISTKTITVTK